ncbi:MAG: FAD-dependent oxidoreductase [Gammaproteobacteria bacterium]|nr:FAD-dependent oxidoreductase [Gammaproteobacteria bacterium]MBQ0840573.1 FAD-dependent oxidoreductase [Gammaproteobacteria bacterium]
MKIDIIGSGVSGLCCAHAFLERACEVRVISASDALDSSCCSWWAGGMLAPGCEGESAEPLIAALGVESMKFWQALTPNYTRAGTLVLATSRDRPLLDNFARNTQGWQKLASTQMQDLEPDLAERFNSGLLFADEAHLDPRQSLGQLIEQLKSRGVEFTQRVIDDGPGNEYSSVADWIIDCRGLGAAHQLPDLRGVKGEMLHIHSTEISLSRPVRLLHPRIPLYIVPRANGVFMIGATMIESTERSRASVRSVLELLSAAYALHPAFGEAEIIEIGVDARPAFNDNLPRLRRRGKTLSVNGMYRHGFLAAPAMARRCVEFALDGIIPKEVMDENTP